MGLIDGLFSPKDITSKSQKSIEEENQNSEDEDQDEEKDDEDSLPIYFSKSNMKIARLIKFIRHPIQFSDAKEDISKALASEA